MTASRRFLPLFLLVVGFSCFGAAAPADLERMQTVIASHLVRFAFREELSVDWQPA